MKIIKSRRKFFLKMLSNKIKLDLDGYFNIICSGKLESYEKAKMIESYGTGREILNFRIAFKEIKIFLVYDIDLKDIEMKFPSQIMYKKRIGKDKILITLKDIDFSLNLRKLMPMKLGNGRIDVTNRSKCLSKYIKEIESSSMLREILAEMKCQKFEVYKRNKL